jgi:ribosomal protein S28E/S33
MTDSRPRPPKTMSRRQVVFIVVLAIAGTAVLEADVFIRRLAVQRTEEVVGGCVELEEPQVDLGGYPVVLRALRGHLDDVRFTADGATLGGLRLTDLRGDIDRVRFRVLGGADDIRVEGANVTARIREDEIEQLLATLGIEGTVRVAEDGVDVRLDDLGTVLRLDLTVVDGAVAVVPEGALQPLMRFELDVPGVTVRTLEGTAGSLLVDAVADGDPREIACAASSLVRTRLRELSQSSSGSGES